MGILTNKTLVAKKEIEDRNRTREQNSDKFTGTVRDVFWDEI